MNTKVDLLIENANSLSPLEEAESTLQSIREGGMVALVASSVGETQVLTAGDTNGKPDVISENTPSAAEYRFPDGSMPFAIERIADPAEKSIEKPLGRSPRILIKTLARKLPGPIKKFLGVSPEPKVVETTPQPSLGRLIHWFAGKKSSNKPASEIVALQKKRTVKRLIRDGFFYLFLYFLRWMVQRTVRNIKKYL